MQPAGKSTCASEEQVLRGLGVEWDDAQALLTDIPPPARNHAFKKYGACAMVIAVMLMVFHQQTPWLRNEPHPLRSAGLGNVIVAAKITDVALQAEWEQALGSSRDLSEAVRTNLEKIRKDAEKARDSMKSWTRAHIFRDAKEMADYVSRSASAASLLAEGESDFREIIGTLAGSFAVVADELEDQLSSSDQTTQHVTITNAQRMLKSTITQALKDLAPLKEKFSKAGREFQQLQSLADAYKEKIEDNIEQLTETRNQMLGDIGADTATSASVLCGPLAAVSAGVSLGVGAPVCMAVCAAGSALSVVVGAAELLTTITAAQHQSDQLHKLAGNFGTLAHHCRSAKLTSQKDYAELQSVNRELNVEKVMIMRSSVSAWKTKVLPSIRTLVADLNEKASQ